MSISWIDYAWKDGPMDSNERFVYLALCNRADAAGKCFPSLSLLVRETRLSESTVRRSIASLEAQGYVEVERGGGAGNTSQYTVKRVSRGNLYGGKRVSHRKVSNLEKGVTQTEKGCQPDGKGCHTDGTPTPPYKSNRQEPPFNQTSAGGNGEFMAASWLMQELGIAGGTYDMGIIAQTILYAAKDAKSDTQGASEFLLQAAQAAIKRGERVTTFWFKDKKFIEEGAYVGTGKGKPSPAKERVDGARRVLAEIALERGLIDPTRFNGGLDTPVPEPGSGGEHS